MSSSPEKLQLDRVEGSITKLIHEKSVRILTSDRRDWWTDFFETIDETFLSTPIELPSAAFQLESLFYPLEIQPENENIPEDLISLDRLVNDPVVDVYVGHKPVDTRKVRNVDDINVSVGQLVAVFHEKVYDRLKRLPLIGRVLEVVDEDRRFWVHIELWLGSYSGKWTCPKKRILEKLTKESVILYDFELTDMNKLRSATKLKLKELYNTYVNISDDEAVLDTDDN